MKYLYRLNFQNPLYVPLIIAQTCDGNEQHKNVEFQTLAIDIRRSFEINEILVTMLHLINVTY